MPTVAKLTPIAAIAISACAMLSGCTTTGTDATAPSVQDQSELIVLDGDRGEQMLREAGTTSDFVQLSAHFDTQDNLAYCGVASAAIAMNVLGETAPRSPSHGDYNLFTQASFFTPEVEQGLREDKVRRAGMTLAQLGGALKAHGADARVTHAEDTNIDGFRSAAKAALSDRDSVVLINYHRPTIGQPGPGHISPLGAYHAPTDRFLIMDVATYRYPFVWVSTAALFEGMSAVDGESQRSRGFIVVSSSGGGGQ